MAAPARLTIAVLSDPSNSYADSVLVEMTKLVPDDVALVVPGFGRTTGNVLDDELLPALESADIALAIWSSGDPLWVAFQVGICVGIGLPLIEIAVEPDDVVNEGRQAVVDDPATILELVLSMEPAPRKPLPVNEDLVLFCPSETGVDDELTSSLIEALPDRRLRMTSWDIDQAHRDALWVITPYQVTRMGWQNLVPNVTNAIAAGAGFGASVAAGLSPKLSIARVGRVRPITPLEHLVTEIGDAELAAGILAASAVTSDLRIRSVKLRNIKCFESIQVDLSTESELGGAWTCLVGVNGAGKSTLLQAIAIALLGRRRAPELGLQRLGRMVRRGGPDFATAGKGEIRIEVLDGPTVTELILPLGPKGIDESRFASYSNTSAMDLLWERCADTLIVSYGATRNISDSPSTSQSLSSHAHRQITLFDPLAQIASTEALTSGGLRFRPQLETIANIVTEVLDEPELPFECRVSENDRLVFFREDARLESVDLPDGFRSILALIADIAGAWHDLHDVAVGAHPADIEGIVLVDELDLHLHARLQRLIVSRLRSVLTGVQWIVSTHSPLIAASFDREEIRLLDRTAEDGLKEIDRQVMSFSTDDLYDWLLDTEPISEIGLEKMREDEGTALLYQTPTLNAEKAEALLASQAEMLEELSRVEKS